MGSGQISHLDPVDIFKGKLRASATRAKFHDSADIRWLEQKFLSQLMARTSEFNLEYVGLALKRYPELELSLARIGIDIPAAKDRIASVDLKSLPPQQPGDVQKGLLGPP